MPMIRRSANRGDPRAQYVLATAMFNGDFAEKDWTTAYALMTRASATGLARASSSLAQMDKFIPLEQRQKGLALARDMELASSRPKVAAVDPIPAPLPPVSVQPMKPDLPTPVRTAPVPQSRAPLMTSSRSALPPPRRAASPAERPVQLPVDAAPEPQWQAPTPAANEPEPDYGTPVYEAPTYEEQPRPVRVPPRAVTPKPVAPKAKPIAGKGWRVQLGAFSEEGKAKAQWSQLKGRISGLGGLQPYLVKAANVTRLQAGPLASRAEADRVCKSAQAAGQGCFPIAP
jgi:cell division septation protein DedD